MENKEMKMFYDWSARHEGEYKYLGVDRNAESYFIKRDKDKYIGEYGFNTIVDLKTELGCLWPGNKLMEEIVKPVTVAAMKKYGTKYVSNIKTDALDEFIYIF